jgi:two-component system, NtrC family, response regulator AtoC
MMEKPRTPSETTTTVTTGPLDMTALRVVVVHGDGTKVVPVVAGVPIVIGRAHPSDIVVPSDASLSRQHARLVAFEGGRASIEDLDSKNGTFVDDARITKCDLEPGAVCRLGHGTTVLVKLATHTFEVDGYDAFERWLEEELVRSRTFGRPLALLAVRLPRKDHAHSIVRAVTSVLRPVDRAGMHAPTRVLVGLPETDAAAAAAVVERLARVATTVSLATFPKDATTVDGLVAHLLGEREQASTPRPAVPGSRAMVELMAETLRIAKSRIPVLVRGETGAGKEVVARTIHDTSPRKAGRFLPLNCGAFTKSLLEAQLFGYERGAFTGANKTTKGAFELADGGTLFLDEVGELSAEAQAALLRVLETKKLVRVGGDEEIAVDVRIVTATHRDLESMAREGTFREDLLYRLDGTTLHVPPLRERPEDVEALALQFITEACANDDVPQKSLSLGAMEALLSYSFPGNVRELRNAMVRAVVIAEGATIEARDLPAKMRTSPPTVSAPPPAATDGPALAGETGDYRERVREELQRFETRVITAALTKAGGNQTAAARELNLPLRTLTHKIRELGIKKSFG